MNNVMDDFSFPGKTNHFDLKPSQANLIVPGKRPMSSMSPSIIVDKKGFAKLVIGAAGGTKIVTSVALVRSYNEFHSLLTLCLSKPHSFSISR